MSMSRGALRMREYRDHYRQFVETRGEGKSKERYNPALDDPNDPRNPMHWVHGENQAYRFAGCACLKKCGPAMSKDNEEQAAKRLDQRLALHRTLTTEALRGLLPMLSEAELREGAESMVGTHTVRDRYRAKVAYTTEALFAALRSWLDTLTAGAPDAELIALCAQLVETLTASGKPARRHPHSTS